MADRAERSAAARSGVDLVVAVGAAVLAVLAAGVSSGRPVFGLALAVAVPFALLTSLRTKAAVYFLVLPVVGWAAIHAPGAGFQGLPGTLALVMGAQLVWEWATGRLALPVRHPLVVLSALLGLVVIVQSRNPIIVPTGQSLSGLRTYVPPMLLLPVGLAVLRSAADIRRFVKVILAGAVPMLGYLAAQIVLGYDQRERAFFASSGGNVITEKKLFATTLAPELLGFVAAFVLLVCVVARVLRVWPRLALGLIPFAMIGVVAAGTRITLLALLPAGLLLLAVIASIPEQRPFVVRIISVAIALLFVLLAVVAATPVRPRYEIRAAPNAVTAAIQRLALGRQATADVDYRNRLDRFNKFVAYEWRHPWGAGPGIGKSLSEATFTQPGHQKPPIPDYILTQPFIFLHETFYFDVGVELGLFALVAFGALLGLALAFNRRALRAAPSSEARVMIGLSMAVVMLVAVVSVTNGAFRSHQTSGVFWFLLSVPVTFGAARRPTPERAMQTLPS